MNTIDKFMSHEYLQSKGFRRTIFFIGVFAVVLLIFQAGMFVGFRKASFSYHMGDNYYRAFDSTRGNMMGIDGMRMGAFPDAHGALGEIIKIDLPTLVIENPQSVEKVVRINNNTLIKKFRDPLKPEDLRVNDFVTIIGSPNDKSEIEAKFIRLMPPPPTNRNATSSLQ